MTAVATFVLGLVVFIVILIVSVAWHELGHLIPAKLFKVPVSQYMIGFGPTAWSKRFGETEFGIKWILLGGYIRMLGMYSPVRSPKAAKTGWRASLADAARETTRDELAEAAEQAQAAPATPSAGDSVAPDGVAAAATTTAEAPKPAPGGGDQPAVTATAAIAKAATTAASDRAEAGNGQTASGKGGGVRIVESVAARAYYNQSAPRKLVIMLGGPTMNLILALFLMMVALSMVGVYQPSTVVSAVSQCLAEDGSAPDECGSETVTAPARSAGIEPGDKIVGWGGQEVRDWNQFLGLVSVAEPTATTVTVERAGAPLSLEITPLRVGQGTSQARSVIGVTAGSLELEHYPVKAVPGVFWNQVTASVELYANLPISVWNTLVDLIEGNERDPQSPSSIVGIARVSTQVAGIDTDDPKIDANRVRWGTWLQLGAAINIALWLFNLLPLLPLDGGHVVNALYEGIRRSWARWRRRPLPGPADSARLMPLTYVVVGLLILMTVILVAADIIMPYRF
ncbi:MAG: site-2 protease family protein [Bifidobacteriaceae bacterium]|nr:site-2 protease family protein [Bifidobacteriaceae bacterium]